MFERCLYFNANALARTVNRIWEQAYEPLGLSPAHAYLLRLVLSKPGISQKQIAGELHLEKSTVTRFVEHLEQQGYLVRRKQGREQLVQASAQCKQIEKKLNQRGDELYRLMAATLDRKTLNELVSMLRQSTRLLSAGD